MNFQSFAVSISLLFSLVTTSQAATYQFSFSNVDGPVSGTVIGLLELPDGDGDFAATSLILESVPTALGYTSPFDVLGSFPMVLANDFSVSNSMIVDAEFGAQRPAFGGGALALNYQGFGTLLSIEGSTTARSGVADSASSTLTFGDPTVVPIPAAWVFLLAGVGMLGITGRPRRKLAA